MNQVICGLGYLNLNMGGFGSGSVGCRVVEVGVIFLLFGPGGGWTFVRFLGGYW